MKGQTGQPGKREIRRTTVTVFGNNASTFALDRYTRELAANFPPSVAAKPVYFHSQKTGIRQQLDRYWGYLRLARREQGDYNVIVSEGCAYLLWALPTERTICVCHDVHSLKYAGPKDLHHRLYDVRYHLNLHLLPRAKFVVTVSRNTRTELLKFCPFIPEEKVIAVHNGIDDYWKPIREEEALNEFRARHQLTGKRVVLHVGGDVFYKNMGTVVRAFTQLTQPDLVLLQVGGLTRETQNLIDTLGIRQRFRHLSNLPDSDLVMLYNIASVLVFPSLSEGFGWPPVEAMACGCPVIASACASLPEVCGDACLYVRPVNVAEVAAAIATVFSDQALRHTLSEQGQQQAAKFSWKKTASEFLELFQRS